MPIRAISHLDNRARTLLMPPQADADEVRVANRLRKRLQWLFTFLDEPGVEATNNRGVRALRPAVITLKLSCGGNQRCQEPFTLRAYHAVYGAADRWHSRGSPG